MKFGLIESILKKIEGYVKIINEIPRNGVMRAHATCDLAGSGSFQEPTNGSCTLVLVFSWYFMFIS
jgi:hypothetical protein